MKRNSIFGLKIIPFYPEYKKTFLSALITPKNANETSSIFEQKPWTTPLEKCHVLHFLEL